MPESLTYNMDCLEAMRQMPDNAFDLAVVDPPYGDGTSSSAPPRKILGAARWHGKQKYHLGTLPAEELPEAGRDLGLRELAEPGRRSLQKNHCVGHSAGRRVFR